MEVEKKQKKPEPTVGSRWVKVGALLHQRRGSRRTCEHEDRSEKLYYFPSPLSLSLSPSLCKALTSALLVKSLQDVCACVCVLT